MTRTLIAGLAGLFALTFLLCPLLRRYGIPVTRQNYLNLAFARNPPQEPPYDGELAAMLDDVVESLGGQWEIGVFTKADRRLLRGMGVKS